MMKKQFGIILLSIVMGVCAMISCAQAMDCSSMRIMMVAADATDGGNLWLRNDTGAKCGNIAAGAQQYFLFHPDQVDKLMAVALTAVSLGKNVWVRAEGDTAGSYVTILSMKPE